MKMKTGAFLVLALVLFIPAAYAGLEESTLISVGLVNQDPDPAIVGDIAKVRLGIENLGGNDANNLVVELAPEYPFTLVPGENAVQKIGTIQGYQGYYDTQNVKIIKYQLRVDRDAKAGSYGLKVRHYEEGTGIVSEKIISLDVKARESAEIIHIDKTTIVPGKQEGLRFSINNVGNAPLRDLTFSWENEDKIILPVGSDNTRYIKYIDVGGSAEIEYQVIADSNAPAGLYQLNLYLTYEQSANISAKKISTIAGVYVGGGTDFDVAFSESSSGTTSFSVANVGSNPATSVSVIIPEQRAWRVSGSSSAMIGNLNKGDYTVASFNLQASNMTSTGNMNFQSRGIASANSTQGNFAQRAVNSSAGTLLMQIAYTDTMGERHIVEKEVRAGAQSAQATTAHAQMMQGGQASAQKTGFFSQYRSYLAAIAVMAAGLVLYQKYKRRKLFEPGFTFKQLLKRKKN